MARKPAAAGTIGPGRYLTILLIVLVALGSWIGLSGHRTPKLGIDLRGGTSVTLIPEVANGQGKVTKAAINQAVDIIRQRVNGSGVAEASVTTQGSGANATIVVSVPGQNQGDLVKRVGETAQLTFRPVLQASSTGVVIPTDSSSPSDSGSSSVSPSSSISSPAVGPASGSPSASGSSTSSAPGSPSPAGRLLTPPFVDASSSASPSTTPSTSPSTSATTSAASSSPTPSASASPSSTVPAVVDPTLLQGTSDVALADIYAAIDCSDPANREGFKDDPDKYLVTCDRDGGEKYILGPTKIPGTEIKSAEAGLDTQGGQGWLILLKFKGKGTREFATFTTQAAKETPGSPANRFAITLDGLVISAPQVNDPIVDGNAQISGSFSKGEARNLAEVLKYGALPLSFKPGEVESISATLGSDQLNAGLIAGALGLFLVVLYSILYYRGLAFVTVLSLAVAGALTYGLIVWFGQLLSFTLTLAGVTGTIVAIGITADSFVVFFERLRDEVREGRSLRTAVENGWLRARRTIIAADLVSILAAAVLYLVSVDKVRGFAFTLGLTTFIDLFVVFFFTKPVMTLLARTEFFGKGHKWSGLDPDRLGRRPVASTAQEV